MKDAFLREVRLSLGEAAVQTAARDLEPLATDWRKRYTGRPLAAIFPSTADQLAHVVKLAHQYQVALVPQGGNTGLSGGATPDHSGEQVILCLTKLKAIRATDSQNKTLTVEAGVTLQEAQEAASAMGLFFPLSLGAEGSATIGGNLATNAGGTGVLRYGTARELCLGIEVVTASGEIWNGLRGLRKDNTGYDLRDLFIGSEGTLGIITAAVLKLYPKPAAVMTALVRVAGPAQALQLMQIAQARCDAALTGFEFMSQAATGLVTEYLPEIARQAQSIIDGSASVLMEISHVESEAAATQLLEAVIAEAHAKGVTSDAIVALSLAQAKALWHLRESITLAAAQDGPHIKHDIALPISALVEFIDIMDRELQAAYPGIRVINFGHFGDGNLHYNVAPPQSAEPRQASYTAFLKYNEDAIRRMVHDRVVAMNGSISAEHGLGQLRRDEARRYKSEVEMGLMRSIKNALDPKGILNPGKVL